eukprot:6396578-Pyramimonas_sp.AAC.1
MVGYPQTRTSQDDTLHYVRALHCSQQLTTAPSTGQVWPALQPRTAAILAQIGASPPQRALSGAYGTSEGLQDCSRRPPASPLVSPSKSSRRPQISHMGLPRTYLPLTHCLHYVLPTSRHILIRQTNSLYPSLRCAFLRPLFQTIVTTNKVANILNAS